MTHGELIKKGLNDWASYFRRTLTDQVAIMYLERIEPFTAKSIQLMFDTAIQSFEPKPSNFPSINYVNTFLGGLEELPIEYDATEDQRFPVSRLWEAFRILEKDGENAFYTYCNRMKMPLNDRQRVIAKRDRAYTVENLFKEE